jgi:hypothetical protein
LLVLQPGHPCDAIKGRLYGSLSYLFPINFVATLQGQLKNGGAAAAECLHAAASSQNPELPRMEQTLRPTKALH